MLHFYKSPKGDYVNFRQMTSLIISHDKSWVVDEAGDRFAIGHADDIPCFINFLNFAIDGRMEIVTHEDFAAFRRSEKRAAGEEVDLDNPPGVGISEGSTPLPTKPETKEEYEKAKKEEDRRMYPDEATPPPEAEKSKGRKGGKKR